MQPSRTDLARLLRYHRRRCELSQAEVAEYLGVSQTAVSLYEVGDRVPHIYGVDALAVLFDVPIQDLMAAARRDRLRRTSFADNDRDHEEIGA